MISYDCYNFINWHISDLQSLKPQEVLKLIAGSRFFWIASGLEIDSFQIRLKSRQSSVKTSWTSMTWIKVCGVNIRMAYCCLFTHNWRQNCCRCCIQNWIQTMNSISDVEKMLWSTEGASTKTDIKPICRPNKRIQKKHCSGIDIRVSRYYFICNRIHFSTQICKISPKSSIKTKDLLA